MTLNEVINQIYDLSVGGYFNGEKFTKERLTNMLKAMFRTNNRYIIGIALPDGWWTMQINQFAPNEFDYIIPDTREEEQKIIDRLYNR